MKDYKFIKKSNKNHCCKICSEVIEKGHSYMLTTECIGNIFINEHLHLKCLQEQNIEEVNEKNNKVMSDLLDQLADNIWKRDYYQEQANNMLVRVDIYQERLDEINHKIHKERCKNGK